MLSQKSSPQDYLSRLQPFLTKEPNYGDRLKTVMNPQPQQSNFGSDFTQQVTNLVQKGHPVDLIHKAIDNVPDITDKLGAKDFVSKMLAKRAPKENDLISSMTDLGQNLAGAGAQTVKNITDPINKYTTPSTYITPGLEKLGAPPMFAVGAGLASDFLVPGGKKKIHTQDMKIMEKFIDYVRLKAPKDLKLEEMAAKVAEVYGMKMPKTVSGLANVFDDVLSKARQKLQSTFTKDDSGRFTGSITKLKKK